MSADPVQVMGTICRQRHEAWTLLVELTTPDAAGWAEGLAGRLVRLRQAVAWLEEEWQPKGVILLEALGRRAERRGTGDITELAQDTLVAAQPGLGRLHRAVVAVHDLCTRELAAWDAADAEAAKARRVEQMTLLVPAGALRAEASALNAARLPVWSPVADVVSAYLLLETGR